MFEEPSGPAVTANSVSAPPLGRTSAEPPPVTMSTPPGCCAEETIFPLSRPPSSTTEAGVERSPLSGARRFGAHLWLAVPAQYQDDAPSRVALPADAFHAVGHEGQLLSVIPSHAAVVLRLGLTRARHRWDHQSFLARVLAALPQDAINVFAVTA